MAFFGPGVTFNTKPKWRQSWWWREQLPGIITWVVFAALAVAVVWVVFHFTGDDDSDGAAAPQSSSSAEEPRTSPPPTPTEQPPLFPDAAKEKSLKGVRAFVKYYFDVVNYTQRTNDVTRLQAIQLEAQCSNCQYQINLYRDIEADGQQIRGGEYQVQSITATPVGADTYSCGAHFIRKAATLRDSDGTTIETAAESERDLTMGVVWSDESWQIVAQKDRESEGS